MFTAKAGRMLSDDTRLWLWEKGLGLLGLCRAHWMGYLVYDLRIGQGEPKGWSLPVADGSCRVGCGAGRWKPKRKVEDKGLPWLTLWPRSELCITSSPSEVR